MVETSPSRLLLNLQLLRFVAATMVVLLHGANYYEDLGGTNPIVTSPQYIGFAGVDIFFVLSGFIIWTTNLRTETVPQIFRYLYRRLARIYLGYWPFFFLCWAMRAWYFPQNLEGVRPLWSFWLLPQDQAGQMLHVAWTLSYELLFYTLFFLLLFSPRRLLALGLVTGAVLAANVYTIHVLNAFEPDRYRLMTPPVRFLTAPVVLEFLLGCFLAHFVASGWRRFGVPALVAGVAVLGWGAVTTYRGIELLPLAYVAAYGGGAALVIYGLHALERRGVTPLPRFAALFGGASYTIYLSHTILYRFARGTGLVEAVRESGFPASIAYALTVAVVLGSSALFYVWIEDPLYRAAKGFVARRPAPAPAPAPAAAEPTPEPAMSSVRAEEGAGREG